MSYHGHYNPYVDHDYFARNDWLTRLINYILDMSTDKQLTIAYAAGAGLAAITLIYVFGPTFLIDGQNAIGGRRKQTVVGLYNPANDCFVNSVLQALAGIGELRGYLVQRILVQAELEAFEKKGLVQWKGKRPMLTRALKTMLDRLNERPLHRKTITTRDFIFELEKVFRSRISRNQQDAQEFLQIVAQTLAEEYEAQEKVKVKLPKTVVVEVEKVVVEGGVLEVKEETGEKERVDTPKTEEEFELVKVGDADEVEATKPAETVAVENAATKPQSLEAAEPQLPEVEIVGPHPGTKHIPIEVKIEDTEKLTKDGTENKKEETINEFGMPMEGKLESGIECLVCGFKPKPTGSNFVVMTLNVPQKSYATLDECFNEHLNTEFIDDFQCAKCKLQKAITVLEKKASSVREPKELEELNDSIARLKECFDRDPEDLPKDIKLPAAGLISVKSRIAKRTYFAHLPNILTLHLSRSIFDYYSRKNSCKVAFPEELSLGPLLDRSKYKLLGLITHRGSHDSGHYECYRRQNSHPPPYSTPLMMPINPLTGVATDIKLESLSVTAASPVSPSTPATPATPAASSLNLDAAVTTQPETATEEQPKSPSPIPSPAVSPSPVPSSAATEKPQSSLSSATVKAVKEKDTLSLKSFPSKSKKQKNPDLRWWRISDDSVKEVKKDHVLGLQKEVYLLFYEKIKVR